MLQIIFAIYANLLNSEKVHKLVAKAVKEQC